MGINETYLKQCAATVLHCAIAILTARKRSACAGDAAVMRAEAGVIKRGGCASRMPVLGSCRLQSLPPFARVRSFRPSDRRRRGTMAARARRATGESRGAAVPGADRPHARRFRRRCRPAQSGGEAGTAGCRRSGRTRHRLPRRGTLRRRALRPRMRVAPGCRTQSVSASAAGTGAGTGRARGTVPAPLFPRPRRGATRAPLREQAPHARWDRVEAALAAHLGERTPTPVDPRQHAGMLFMPGLSTAPFPDPTHLPWLPAAAVALAGVREEIAACLEAALPAGGSGRVPICLRGIEQYEARRHARRLLARLAELPLARVSNHAPDVEI